MYIHTPAANFEAADNPHRGERKLPQLELLFAKHDDGIIPRYHARPPRLGSRRFGMWHLALPVVQDTNQDELYH